MTTVNLAAVANALQTEYESDITNCINRSSPLLELIEKKNFRGKNITWDVRLGTVSAGASAAIAEGAAVSSFNTDTKTPAVLQYATMHEAFEVTGLALAAAANSGQPQALIDLFDEEVKSAAQRLAKALGEELYAGDGTSNRITGLNTALAASGTYAGIDRGTYGQWAANVQANGSVPRALSLALMRASMRVAATASGFRPDLIFCDPVQFDKYGALIDPQRRLVDDVRVAGQAPIKLDGGYRMLEFDGRTIIEDINATAGKMYFLNSRQMQLGVLPQPTGAAVAGASTVVANAGADEKNSGMTGLSARIQPLAVAGDKFQFAIYLYVQLAVRSPNAHTVLADLETT